MDIDLVYLWCSDSEHCFKQILDQTRREYLFEKNWNKLDTRVTDHNELRYSLRSVEKFAPWIRHIYIVTSKQTPEWLNLNHPKIIIVDHSEIIPKEYLPTFNSNVIEAFLHKIPGLSEFFLYANDDMFFGKETRSDFFFDENGHPIHYIQYTPKYSQIYWNKILKKAKTLAENGSKKQLPSIAPFPSHNIDPYTKSLYSDTVEHFLQYYQKMFPNKFRRNNDISRFLVSCWGNLTNRLVWKEITKKQRDVYYYDIINDGMLDKFLKEEKPNLFCMNDQDYLDKSDYQCQTKLLQTLFPDKSAFEKDNNIIPPSIPDYGLKPAFSKNNIPVIFTVNEKFLPFCGITIRSLINNISPKYNYDIIVLSCGGDLTLLKDLITPKLPHNVSFRLFDVSSFLVKHKKMLMKNFPEEKVVKWSKLFIHEWLNYYKKVLYLDTDILVKCDVAELWNTNLEGKAVGGVADMPAHHLESNKAVLMNEIFHCDNIDNYINLGVMLMDLDILRKMDFTQKIFDLTKSIPEKFWNLYDIFNTILYKNINHLPMTYNYQNSLFCKGNNLYPFFEDKYYLAFQKARNEGPKIVHFSGIQPWNKMLGIESFNWWKTAKKTDFYEMILLGAKEIAVPTPAPKKVNK